jgi:glycosyltransferase involved in cell wall biosynthesis
VNLWFVTAAHGRYDVTRLALAQRAHLRGVLAGRGIDLRCVVVAEDANLAVAEEFGFDTLEHPNNPLGAKVNAGIEYACEQDADWVCWCGSDDWMHADLFANLPTGERPPIVSGRMIAIVDLEQPRLQRLTVRTNVGAPPWLIPRWALQTSGFRPIREDKERGLDGSLVVGMENKPEWIFRDPHDLCRVDFKSAESMSPYSMFGSLAFGAEVDPWVALADRYPADLVEMAAETSNLLAVAA